MKITLDPGHGQNNNQSPNNKNYYEGNQMWKLANFLKEALAEYGFEVITTRPKITDKPSLDSRGSTAGKNGSVMFISLHSNAPAPNADGSYSSTPTGTTVYYSLTDSAKNKNIADKIGKKVAEIMGHNFRGSFTKQYPGKPAWDYYGVIRSAAQSGCKCAMLVEHGFHTNIKDSNFLLSDANLKKLAEGEAAVIAEHFGMKKKSTAKYRVFDENDKQIGAFAEIENTINMIRTQLNKGKGAKVTIIK